MASEEVKPVAWTDDYEAIQDFYQDSMYPDEPIGSAVIGDWVGDDYYPGEGDE